MRESQSLEQAYEWFLRASCHAAQNVFQLSLNSQVLQLEAEFFAYVCAIEQEKDSAALFDKMFNTASVSVELAKSESMKQAKLGIMILIALL